MLSNKLVLLAVAMVAAVTVIIGLFLRNVMGKPVRGVLHVPQGKTRVGIGVLNDKPLRPFKYGQVFEVTVLAETEACAMGTLEYRGTPVGVADASSSYVQALDKLARENRRVLVSAVIATIDGEGRPVIELELPSTSWFKRALGQRNR